MVLSPVGPGSFQSYSLSVGLYRPGSFQSDFRGGSFLPNFGESFRPTYFYRVLIGNKRYFGWSYLFCAVLLIIKSFPGFPG